MTGIIGLRTSKKELEIAKEDVIAHERVRTSKSKSYLRNVWSPHKSISWISRLAAISISVNLLLDSNPFGYIEP